MCSNTMHGTFVASQIGTNLLRDPVGYTGGVFYHVTCMFYCGANFTVGKQETICYW